jgi:hypothetical protein
MSVIQTKRPQPMAGAASGNRSIALDSKFCTGNGLPCKLKNNEYAKVISECGHTSIQITIDLYSHLFPNIQSDAAENLFRYKFRHPSLT